MKLAKCKVTIESFQSKEQRMLIIKEGLTDSSIGVREACFEFLKQSMLEVETTVQDEKGKVDSSIPEQEVKYSVISDLSYMFKLVDCKQMFIKEYYIQLPFILMRFIFHLVGENDVIVSSYLDRLLNNLK